MGLAVSLIILVILVFILITLFTDEKRMKAAESVNGKMTEYWNGPERRKSVRIDAALKTKYSVDKNPNQSKNDTLSKNISLGGMLLQLCEKLYPSTLLLLDIFLPDDKIPVIAKGEVVWVKELPDLDESGRRTFDAGIKFTSINPKDKERLDKQINYLIERQHG